MQNSFISSGYCTIGYNDNTPYQNITVNSNSNPFSSISGTSLSDISNNIAWLKKGDGTCFSTDDIVTKMDIMDENFLWKQLFSTICQRDPAEVSEYMTIFKLYNEDYKNTVIAIETAKKEK